MRGEIARGGDRPPTGYWSPLVTEPARRRVAGGSVLSDSGFVTRGTVVPAPQALNRITTGHAPGGVRDPGHIHPTHELNAPLRPTTLRYLSREPPHRTQITYEPGS
ncbi:hypothetical protein GCM10017771_44360 [Streptomyces capitiformicae]|uniref:Uncharacterized protein n=1 Tax=Streptomyces capitiformicae TaxID=2014920 RepID=A0A918Z105_9ACTN|nr:hypothetical protein GCM10017771_44360 [Streptomyces capitiformicae]